MTAEGSLPADDGRLFCYRHPDRETWVRCGRCDRPICTSCAMQGPVGFRCRDCGKPVRDPMALSPAHAAAAAAISFGGGLITAYIASRFGLFALLVAFFAGGVIAEAVTRVVGYKAGPALGWAVYGGIVVGALAAFWLGNADAISLFLAQGAGAGAGQGQTGVGSYLSSALFWATIGAVATCAGARSRMR
jgi:hypothetical protein